jgi:AraC-like DNA-binding protein
VAANQTKREPQVVINPTASQIGGVNAILWGRAKQYHVAEFPGPLSIKSVVRGSGVWETAEAERVVDSASYLVLNAGRPYSITIDAHEIVETFCLFFRAGFAEDVNRVERGAPTALLDEPTDYGSKRAPLEFFETLYPHDAEVSPLLSRMHQRISDKSATDAWLEDQFFAVARAMLKVRGRSEKQAARIPAKKMSTRQELYRRLLRGKDYLDSFFAGEVQLQHPASAACVSPYHFHRLFREVFHETPNQYLQRRRLTRARRLLASTDQSVTEICLAVGFESMTSFSALFRRTFGHSPREYRSLLFHPARDDRDK